jgi:RHS repeat-associated protein
LGVGIDDTATGLTHIGAREYDHTSGRFLSADPIIDIAYPLQMNGYAYANNSPVSHSDPTGLWIDDGTGHSEPRRDGGPTGPQNPNGPGVPRGGTGPGGCYYVRQLEIVDSEGEHEGYSQVQLEYRYGVDIDLRSLRSYNSWWFRGSGASFDEWLLSVNRDPVWGIVRDKVPVEFAVSQELS